MRILTDAEVEPFVTPWRKAIVEDFDPDKEEVYDADTYTLLIDLGFDSWIQAKVRLLGLSSLENPRLGVDAWDPLVSRQGDLALLGWLSGLGADSLWL